jgi:hypothetical protein
MIGKMEIIFNKITKIIQKLFYWLEQEMDQFFRLK